MAMEDYKDLKCAKCKLYLSVAPITYSNGFFCGRCSNPSDLRVTKYEKLASKCKFPCRYNKNGCLEMKMFDKIAEHETTCDKRPILCPVFHCNKAYLETQFGKHFKENHPENLAPGQLLSISLMQKINVYLLEEENYQFLVQTKVNEKGVLINVSNVGKNFNKHYQKYQAKLLSPNLGKNLTLENHKIQRYQIAAKWHHQVPKSILEYLSGPNLQIWLELTLAPDLQKSNHELLRLVECPICFEYMSSVQQCATGHSFCETCTKKMPVCPICKRNFPSTTNYQLETLAKQLLYPCKNQDKGCGYIGNLQTKLQHESNCYVCPKNCRMFGELQEVVQHCQKEHFCWPQKIVFAKCSLRQKMASCLIYADNNIFVYNRFVNEHFLYCNAVFLGPKNKARLYNFTILFRAGGNVWETIAFTEKCRSLSEEKEDLEKDLKVPVAFLKPYIRDSVIYCDITIEKH